jgi:general secretion pathway protein A
MFYEYYGLSGLPFEERIAPDKMLADARFTAALSRLDYFIQGGMTALLTGPTGVGKSSLLRLFVQKLPANRYQPLYLHLTHVQSTSFLRTLVTALDEKPGLGKDRLFAQILNKTRSSDRITILIIDEAHLLTEEALTDLRLLISTGWNEEAKLKIVLCGQETLNRLLARHSLADLVNRIAVRYQLFALTTDQTICYIDHRLQTCGGSEKLFDEEAKQQIHDYAGGLPRVINNLATVCLIQGAAKKQKHISSTIVEEAAAELRLL